MIIMELALKNSAVADSHQDANHTQTADMQPNETDNILQFPATAVGIQQETGPKRKWLLVLAVTLAALLVVAVIAVTIHYTYRKEPHETSTTYTAASTPKTKTENREVWLPYGEDKYLLWQRKGADCDRAKEYCAKRNAALAVIDQNNVHWLKKLSKGKRLWILKEVLEGSGSEDSETIETGDLTCTLLHSNTTSGSGDGCICMRGG